ncbi:hypothetical protein Glove_303g118 [Diversispora epigaea]|uniref:Uncharacterized protein n=1 Tax=Diversispora epigaea TaxID=1348612 RepID=A0A397I0L2_9GLOM|nr:hypothetical protein Glove_303g118 [Diversispora epigaea]
MHVTEQSNLNDSEIVINKETKKILPEIEVSITTTPSIKSYHTFNSKDIVNENNEFSKTVTIIDSFSDFNSESSDGGEDENEFLGEKDKSLLETKTSTPSNLAYNHADFCNKMAEQYPGLYWKGSDGNDDYYGITDKFLCPLCKLDHYEDYSIKGRYKTGSYFIKCEQRGIKIGVTA